MSKFNKMIAGMTILSVSLGSIVSGSLPAKAASRCGVASHYGVGDSYGGGRTASGEILNPYANTAAHPYLPLGSKVLVTNSKNGNSIIVRIIDRGPHYGGRILDLTYGAFSKIANVSNGTALVCYSVMN